MTHNNWLRWKVENITADKELKGMRHQDIAYFTHLSYLSFWDWSWDRDVVITLNQIPKESSKQEELWDGAGINNSSQAERKDALCCWITWGSNKQWLWEREAFMCVSAHTEKGGQLLWGSVATYSIVGVEKGIWPGMPSLKARNS